ncbi:CWC16 protein [Butyriboletus roseoflavus]|nr:CWC16 protein [Butyriboletus roseoflavus]
MGVRYNAEKKKVGSYYSTPIYSFRCKCHLCDGWFEIQTDPKNTRYVVVSGARQKDEEWNPEENGGFAIHGTRDTFCPPCRVSEARAIVDTDGNAGPADPLAALEKSTTAQDHVNKVQIPRLESLQEVSDRYNSDPYALSSLVRKRFRAEKKIDAAKRAADDQLKGRYGLPETLQLAAEDDESKNAAREQWERGRREHEVRTSIRRARLQSSAVPLSLSSTSSSQGRDPLALLKARVLSNTLQSRTFKPPDGLK